MPIVSRLEISNLHANSTMPLGHCNLMHSRHRVDRPYFLRPATCTVSPEMDLSINRRGIFENRWPVNIPICEDWPRIARNGDKTRWTMKARQFQIVAESV